MCGIGGQLSLSWQPPDRRPPTIDLAAALHHRGPDAAGQHLSPPVALAHARLSIIDLDAGRQPMSNETGTVWITYNGELYNYRELRRELLAAGHTFRTQSDTEVIVHAWEEWGEECVRRFRGMFAFGIADWDRRVLFVARDHLGIKPLYYYLTRESFAFASELQALRTLPDFPDEIDPRAIDNYLFLLYVPPPRTIYRGVSKLPPGHRMTVTFEGRTSGSEAYWALRFKPEYGVRVEEWTERLEGVLRESVRAHLVSDVPFGAFLSGGLDSTAVVGWMAEELAEPVQTFSIGFDEDDFSEVQYAREVARYWKTEHHEEIVRADAVGILPQLVRHYGEPFGDSSAIPTYYVSRLARRHVPMVLTGDGGDEALLGYGRYTAWARWLNPGVPRRAWWKRMSRPMLRRAFPRRFKPDGVPREPRVADWFSWVGSLRAQTRRELWHPEYRDLVDEPIEELDAVAADAAGVSREALGQYFDYRTYLPHDILTKVDIATMCHGLEARTPLVDVRVAEFAATIPWEMNLNRNGDGAWSGKQLLKRILRRHFAEEFVKRRKMGFGVPLRHWFGEGGALRRELEERLGRRDAAVFDYFQPQAVRLLMETNGREGVDNSQALWQLLFFEAWLNEARVAVPVERGLFKTPAVAVGS